MPKIKTRKTLLSRVRVTKNGKIIKKRVMIGHLKRKWSADKTSRKNRFGIQENSGHRKMFKKLLAKMGKNI